MPESLTPELEAALRRTMEAWSGPDDGGTLAIIQPRAVAALLAELDACRAERDRLRASIAWRCSSCGCAFPDHPSLAWPTEIREATMGGVTRCSVCAELDATRQRCAGLADRVAAQSELLSRRAEKAEPAEVARLHAALELARGVLRSVEWEGDQTDAIGDPRPSCPACNSTPDRGHRDDCPLARALAVSGGPTPGTPPGPSAAPGSGGPPSGP